MNNSCHLARKALEHSHIRYLVTDRDLNVIISMPEGQEHRSLVEVLPALAGMEDVLQDIKRGNIPHLYLPHIAVEIPEHGEPRYETYRISSHEPTGGLFVVVQEATESAALLQEVSQQYNELVLLREKLDQHTRALEEANQRLRVLNQERTFLITMINHDIRTPLATILNSFTLLLRSLGEDLSEEQMEFIRMGKSAAESARDLADLILQVERVHQGEEATQQEAIHIVALLREIIHRHRPQIKAKQLDVVTEFKDVPNVTGDWSLLREAFSNILDNAIKYNRLHGSITIRAYPHEGGVLVEIQDTGVGIAAEDIPYVFRPFRRGRDTGERRSSGMGLGLYIAHKIVSLHNGRMWVESRPDQGSQVSIWLPATH